MTIACTRCGATCEGDIIVPPLAFGFKHELGCGHGVGPLAVLPGSFKAKPKISDVEITKEVESVMSPGTNELHEVVEKTESRAERRRAKKQKE